MRAYIAVIKDSFREALASRVLWILLALITLFLALLAPLKFHEKFASTLHRPDITDQSRLLTTLADKGPADGEQTAISRVWGFLPADLQENILAHENNAGDSSRNASRLTETLRHELNELLKRTDLYDEAAWKNVYLDDEAREYRKRGPATLRDDELGRFNRLLLEAAFPEQIRISENTAIQISYLGFEPAGDLPLTPSDIRPVVKQVLAMFMYWLVGVIGVFTAILVTSPMIPRTFEAGSIDLLLSKPVSRSLLFLAKFVGGCAFVLLNATYLIAGLALIAGWRFDIWSGKLLLCIPVFLFIFAIYYSISAFAGVVWRGAIMSVVLTVVAWGLFFAVGALKGGVELFVLNESRLAVVLPDVEPLIVTNKGGKTFEWDADRQAWGEIFTSSEQRPPQFGLQRNLIGPVYDPVSARLVAVELTQMRGGRFNMGGSPGKLLVGTRENGWTRKRGVSLPAPVSTLIVEPDGALVAAGRLGIFRLVGEASAEHRPFKLFGVDIAQKQEENSFVSVGPEEAKDWKEPFAVAGIGDISGIIVYEGGRLHVLESAADGKFAVRSSVDLETDEPATLAAAGDTVLVALGSGEVRIFDLQNLEPVSQFTPFGGRKPKLATASLSGHWFAVLFHNRQVWCYDAVAAKSVEPPVTGQGDILAVSFTAADRVLLADRFTRVIEYDPQTWSQTQTWSPESDWVELSYRYLVVPIYTVFPKPSELNNVVNYLLMEDDTQAMGGNADDLESEHLVVDVWTPIWSNLAFLGVMLTVTCIYVARKDF